MSEEVKLLHAKLSEIPEQKVEEILHGVVVEKKLKAMVAESQQTISGDDLTSEIVSQVVDEYVAREECLHMETQTKYRMQPFRVLDEKYKLLPETLYEIFLKFVSQKTGGDDDTLSCLLPVFYARTLGFSSVGRVHSWSSENSFNFVVLSGEEGKISFRFFDAPDGKEYSDVSELSGLYDLANALILI